MHQSKINLLYQIKIYHPFQIQISHVYNVTFSADYITTIIFDSNVPNLRYTHKYDVLNANR